MDETKKEQMKSIKNRLFDKFCESGFTVYKLLEEVQNASGFSLNYDTFRKTIDPTSTTLDIYSVIALCRYWNLDISYVLSTPDNTEIPMPGIDKLVDSSKFSILNDDKYTGTYHGYMYSNKKVFSHIEHFELTIGKYSGQFKADMLIHAITTTDGEHKTELKKHLTGIPIHAHPNTIFIIFTNNVGEFFIVSFNYVPYRRKKMYFKQGFVVSCATEISRPVSMQRFVLFSKPVSSENMKYIPGLLLLNDRTFHVPVNVMDELKESDPIIKIFFDKFGYLLEHSKNNVYCISEAQILNSYSPTFSTNDILKALTIMKSFASDANRITITESDAFAEFSKLLH